MNVLRFLITPAAVLLGCFGGSYVAVRTLNTETIQAQAAKDPKAKPDVIVASGISVVDEKGRIRFAVGIANDNETILRLSGPDDASQVMLSTSMEKAELGIWHGKDAENRASITANKAGMAMVMQEGEEKNRSLMAATLSNGDASVVVGSAKHGANASTLIADGAASLQLAQFVKTPEQNGGERKENSVVISTNATGGLLAIYGSHLRSEEPKGVTHLRLDVDNNDVGISMLSPFHQARTNLLLEKNGALFFLTRSFGAGTKLKDVNVSLTATDTGSALLLGGVKEHKETIAWPRVIAGVNEEGAGTVEVYDKNGKVAWMTPKK